MDSVRLEDSPWEVDLLTKTLGGHQCTFQSVWHQALSHLHCHDLPV